MDLGFLQEYCVPVILAACLVVNYCIRHIRRLSRISGQYLPTVMTMMGLLLSIPVTLGAGDMVTVQSLVGGAVTGLASTGLQQIFKDFLERKIKRNESKRQNH